MIRGKQQSFSGDCSDGDQWWPLTSAACAYKVKTLKFAGETIRTAHIVFKAKAVKVHSVSWWTRGVQVKLWDPLRTRAIPERLRGVFTRRYSLQIHVYLTLLYLYDTLSYKSITHLLPVTDTPPAVIRLSILRPLSQQLGSRSREQNRSCRQRVEKYFNIYSVQHWSMINADETSS